MIFDTDIFIWIQRGHAQAAEILENEPQRFLSVQSYMELLQGASSKLHLKHAKSFIADMGCIVLPLTENIGHRALIYIEQHTLASGLFAGDAIIAATAKNTRHALTNCNPLPPHTLRPHGHRAKIAPRPRQSRLGPLHQPVCSPGVSCRRTA